LPEERIDDRLRWGPWLMRGAMPCSRWSESPARTISMRPTSPFKRSSQAHKPARPQRRPVRMVGCRPRRQGPAGL